MRRAKGTGSREGNQGGMTVVGDNLSPAKILGSPTAKGIVPPPRSSNNPRNRPPTWPKANRFFNLETNPSRNPSAPRAVQRLPAHYLDTLLRKAAKRPSSPPKSSGENENPLENRRLVRAAARPSPRAPRPTLNPLAKTAFCRLRAVARPSKCSLWRGPAPHAGRSPPSRSQKYGEPFATPACGCGDAPPSFFPSGRKTLRRPPDQKSPNGNRGCRRPAAGGRAEFKNPPRGGAPPPRGRASQPPGRPWPQNRRPKGRQQQAGCFSPSCPAICGPVKTTFPPNNPMLALRDPRAFLPPPTYPCIKPRPPPAPFLARKNSSPGRPRSKASPSRWGGPTSGGGPSQQPCFGPCFNETPPYPLKRFNSSKA